MRILLPFLFAAVVLQACDGNSPSQSTERSATRDTSAQREAPAATDPVAELTDRITDDPNDPNLYLQRSQAYRDRGMYELALRDIERAKSIDPTSSHFHFVEGQTEFIAGHLRDSRLALEKAVQLDESNVDALLLLAEVHFLQRRYDAALQTVNRALRIDEHLAQGYFIKGFVYKELGDTTVAKSSFQTAVEVDPNHYDSYMQLGSLYGHQGDPIALEYFETALEIRPKSAEAFYHRGMFLQAGGKYDEALANYRDMIDADPNNPLGYYNSGYIYLTQKLAFDTAMAYFDSTLAVRPDYVDAVYNKGLCYEEMGKPGMAEREYATALEMDPQYDLAAQGMDRIRR